MSRRCAGCAFAAYTLVHRCTTYSAHPLHACRYGRYDKDGTGLDRTALRTVLSDLGRLEGLRPADVEARLDQAFAIADRDGNGRISAHEFARWGRCAMCVVLKGGSGRWRSWNTSTRALVMTGQSTLTFP